MIHVYINMLFSPTEVMLFHVKYVCLAIFSLVIESMEYGCLVMFSLVIESMEWLRDLTLQVVYEKYRLQVRSLGYSASVGGNIYGTRLERKQNREEAHVVQRKKIHLFQVDVCDPQKAYQNGFISLLEKKKPGTTFALKRVDRLGDSSGIVLWHAVAHLTVKYSKQYAVQSLPYDQKDKSMWNFYAPGSDDLHGLATKILVKNSSQGLNH